MIAVVPAPPSPAEPEKTLSERAHRLLRGDILRGTLAPGEKLKPQALATRYGIGLSPLREGLTRLSTEGLVVAEGQRGFRVADISLAELHDIMTLRRQLEIGALSEAIRRGDADWEAEILAAYHRLSRTPMPLSEAGEAASEQWEERHGAFHRALISACGSAWLLRFCAQLEEHSQRYRRLRMFYGAPVEEGGRDEHRELMTAALDRDAATAGRLLAEHLDRTERAAATLFEQLRLPESET